MNIEDARPACQQDRDAGLTHLLQRCWTYPLTTKSNDARAFADEISEGASRQFLTTQIVPGPDNKIWGRIWKVTPLGLSFLWDNANLLTFEEVRYIESYTAGVRHHD